MSIRTGLVNVIARALRLPPLYPVDNRGGWWPVIRESFTGAWQQNVEIRTDTVLSYSAVYACIQRIATDVSKLRVKLVEQEEDSGIWTEVMDASPFKPVLRKPNRYQTRIKFFSQWITSKLINGNTYVLKERDARGVVVALYILDSCPGVVVPLVSPDGSVFYQVSRDYLAGISEVEATIAIPASEIIHDTMVTLFHPLVGVSPIYACGLAATQGVAIQSSSANFFANASRPGGILTAPGEISNDQAARLKNQWETNFTGANSGKVAVLGDGLKWEAVSISAEDSQLMDQLHWTAETVCSCFGVPAFMIGAADIPESNVEALTLIYYTQCLQRHIEEIELLLDEGLDLPPLGMGTEFDLDGLLRMDTASLYDTLGKGVGAAVLSPNEARRKLDLEPVAGGDSPYLQQQNYSLEALARRDAQANPFAASQPQPQPQPQPATPAPDGSNDSAANDNAQAAAFEALYLARKEIAAL